MKLQQNKHNKFSIVLTIGMVFLALLAVAAAQGRLDFTDHFAGIFSVNQNNSNKIVLTKTDFLNNAYDRDGNSDKGGAGNSIQCFDPTFTGGISIAVGDLDSDSLLMNRIDVSRISLLTGVFDGGVGVVDSCDAEATSKIRTLFEVRKNLRLTSDIVIDIPQNNTREWFEATNYLRGAQASASSLPVLLLIRDQKGFLHIELKPVYITSYQTGGNSGDIVPTDQLSLNFAAIKFEYKPQDDKGKE